MANKILKYRKPKEPTIISKAWKADKNQFSEPWFVDYNVYYGSRGECKPKAIIDFEMLPMANGEELTFLNIKLVRAKELDKVLYEGKELYRYEIAKEIRNKKIKNLPDNKNYYVQDSRSFCGNSVFWWALNGNGYTTDIHKAHRYTKQEIQSFINGRETDIIWEADFIDGVVNSHVDAQRLDNKFKI